MNDDLFEALMDEAERHRQLLEDIARYHTEARPPQTRQEARRLRSGYEDDDDADWDGDWER